MTNYIKKRRKQALRNYKFIINDRFRLTGVPLLPEDFCAFMKNMTKEEFEKQYDGEWTNEHPDTHQIIKAEVIPVEFDSIELAELKKRFED